MARNPIISRQKKRAKTIQILTSLVSVFSMVFVTWFRLSLLRVSIMRPLKKSKEQKILERTNWLFRLTRESASVCISQLHMDRRTFDLLCEMVSDVGGLKGTKNMSLEEIVALFLYVLAHHKKNRTISLLFLCSGETISRQFNNCLLAILKLHDILLKRPEPIIEECEDYCWKSFKGCLGALDGTLIRVTPPSDQKPRYRTRKSSIATNMLGVSCPNMQFIYVLPGWEGSAHDDRVLRDAISSLMVLEFLKMRDIAMPQAFLPLFERLRLRVRENYLMVRLLNERNDWVMRKKKVFVLSTIPVYKPKPKPLSTPTSILYKPKPKAPILVYKPKAKPPVYKPKSKRKTPICKAKEPKKYKTYKLKIHNCL
ncbi:protein ALP1 [Artemisia annua]|uniref:Protein ALP1 n=1 Tax=Artemisia annua TaxID=35608 RepID=A0A2U1MJV1_ARTAN|nr:protein ALP1 [Artemisia annua]